MRYVKSSTYFLAKTFAGKIVFEHSKLKNNDEKYVLGLFNDFSTYFLYKILTRYAYGGI